MKTRTYLKVMPVLVVAAFLSACGSTKQAQETATPVVSGVSVVAVHTAPSPEYYQAVGTVKSDVTSVLGAEISGTVTKILVKEGDHVRQGQLLALIDSRVQKAQLDAAAAGIEESNQGLVEVKQALQAAEAQRKFAEATFKRYKALLAQKSVTQQEYDNAETQYTGAVANEMATRAKLKQVEAKQLQARAQHTTAATVFSYSRIVSPIDGVITAKSVDAGTLVMPGTPLFTVEKTGRFRLDAGVPERFHGVIHVGESVPVTLGSQQVEGRIVEIVPAADPSTRTFIAKVALPGNCKCQSGQYGSADLAIGTQNRIMVPVDSLVQRGELEGLFVVDSKGIATYRLVKTGQTFGNQVEILSGLDDGERVAVTKIDQLSDGVRVQTS